MPVHAAPLPLTGPSRAAGVSPTVHSAREVARGTTPAWLPGDCAAIMLVSAAPQLHGEVGRVAAAAAVDLVIAGTWDEAAAGWTAASAVLVGTDMRSGPIGRIGPVILVGMTDDSPRAWERAAAIGADRVVILPQGAQWLADHLAHLGDRANDAPVVGVVGGCGGAGASTLAALLAVRAGSGGLQTLLVDGDEWGGGLDHSLAGDDVGGIRWMDLLASAGSINPEQLATALPVVGGCSLLAWGTQDPGPRDGPAGRYERTAVEVLAAARRAYGLVVVDLSRSREGLTALAPHCTRLLIVVPGRLRALAACARIIAELPPGPAALVVRGPLRDGLDAPLIAASLGLPDLGVLPFLRTVTAAADDGRLAEAAGTRPVRRFLDALLQGLGSPEDHATRTTPRTPATRAAAGGPR